MWRTLLTPPQHIPSIWVIFRELLCDRCWPKHFHGLRQRLPSCITPLAPCCYPAVSAAIFPVPPPHLFPPPIVFCRIGFSPISTLCSALAFFPAFFLFTSSVNVVAYLVNCPSLPPWIPSVLGANVGSFSFSHPWFPPKGFLAGCLRILAAYSSSSSSSGSFDSPVAYPARFPLFF